MATATSKSRKPGKAAAAPVTFDDIARDKMRDTISEYRSLVERAANNEQLSGKELARVLDLLTYMGLPDFAWERDLKAQREYIKNAASESEAQAKMPEAQTRAAAATKRIEALEKELKQLKEQRHRDTETLPRTIIGYGQRRNELKTLNPHLFASLDNAARMRIDDKNKTRRMPAEPLGWST